MAKNKPNAQPWSGEEAPKEEAQTDTAAEGDESEDEESEGEELTDENADEEKEAEVSAAIRPAKKKKKDEGLTGDGIKRGVLVEGDHLPNEVITRVAQGVALADAIAEYNEKH